MKVDLQKNERGECVLIKIGAKVQKWIGRYPSSKRIAEEMADLWERDVSDFD